MVKVLSLCIFSVTFFSVFFHCLSLLLHGSHYYAWFRNIAYQLASNFYLWWKYLTFYGAIYLYSLLRAMLAFLIERRKKIPQFIITVGSYIPTISIAFFYLQTDENINVKLLHKHHYFMLESLTEHKNI